MFEHLRLASPEDFERVDRAEDLLGGDGLMHEFQPASARPFQWAPAFGSDGAPAKLRGWTRHAHGLRVTALRDAVVIQGGGVFDHMGRVPLDCLSDRPLEIASDHSRSATLFNDAGLLMQAEGTFLPRSDLTAAEDIEEPCFHLINHADHTFTHFLFDALPKLALWDRMPGPKPKVLVSQAVWNSRRDYIQRITGRGPDAILVLQPHKPMRFRQLYVGSFPQWDDASTIRVLRRASDEFPTGNRKIFIARKDQWAWDRMLLNEAEVIALFEARGFEVVVPSAMNQAEQARLYRSASMIAGCYGGGILNAVFCAPGTRVLSIHSPDYLRPILDETTGSTGLHLAHALGESFSAYRDRNNSPFIVDPAALRAALEALQDPAEQPLPTRVSEA